MSAIPAPMPSKFPAAPDLELRAANGTTVRLSTLWAARPLALAVLPPFGTELCADNAAQLRDNEEPLAAAGGALAAIIHATPEAASVMAKEWNLGYTLLCDKTNATNDGFQLELDGFGRALPASFIIDTTGRVTHEHRADSPYDYAGAWTLVDEISEITGRKVERPEPPLNVVPPSALAGASSGRIREDAPSSVRAGGWSCLRCGVRQCELNDVATASGFLSRMFNLQNRRFVAVSCLGCGYTELYKKNSSAVMNIVDVLAGA